MQNLPTVDLVASKGTVTIDESYPVWKILNVRPQSSSITPEVMTVEHLARMQREHQNLSPKDIVVQNHTIKHQILTLIDSLGLTEAEASIVKREVERVHQVLQATHAAHTFQTLPPQAFQVSAVDLGQLPLKTLTVLFIVVALWNYYVILRVLPQEAREYDEALGTFTDLFAEWLEYLPEAPSWLPMPEMLRVGDTRITTDQIKRLIEFQETTQGMEIEDLAYRLAKQTVNKNVLNAFNVVNALARRYNDDWKGAIDTLRSERLDWLVWKDAGLVAWYWLKLVAVPFGSGLAAKLHHLWTTARRPG